MTAPDPLAAALFLIVGLVLAGLLHSAWLRSAASRRFAVPLDGGRRLRGRRLLGDNKTLRGLMVMVPGTGLSFALLAALLGATSAAPLAPWPMTPWRYGLLGVWAGLGFMLGELPNSFVKRQLDVPPGRAPRSGPAAALSFVVDRLDSIVGMLAAVSLVVPTPWRTWAWVVVLGPGIHWAFSVLLFRLGVKERAA